MTLSSLLQLSILRASFVGSPTRKVVVVTANSASFDLEKMIPSSLMAAEERDTHIRLLDGENTLAGKWVGQGRSFTRLTADATDEANVEAAVPDMISAMRAKIQEIEASEEGAKVVACVIECTEMNLYTNAIRYEFGIPTYDIISLADWISAGLGVGVYVVCTFSSAACGSFCRPSISDFCASLFVSWEAGTVPTQIPTTSS